MAELLALRNSMDRRRRARDVRGTRESVTLPPLHKPEMVGGLATVLAQAFAKMEYLGELPAHHDNGIDCGEPSIIDDSEWEMS